MLKISDEGLRSFSKEYKRIILNKIKYGNLYSEYLENIYDQSLKLTIEDNIEKILVKKSNSNNLIEKIKDKTIDNNEDDDEYKFCERLFESRIYTKKSMENFLVEYNQNNINADQLLSKQDRLRFLYEHYPSNYKKISDKYYFNKIFDNNNINKFAKTKKSYDRKINDLNNLIENDKNNSKFDILGRKQIQDFVLLEYNDLKLIINEVDKLKCKSKFIKICTELFDYEKFIDTNLRHTILNKINLNVCPYCGRQFISSYDTDNKKKNTADLDHFFIKSAYPYLALSLFNFIPSCQICNSRMKLSTDFHSNEHLYPYIEGFGKNAVFDIDNSVLITDIISGKVIPKIVIDIKNEDTKIINSIKTFKLDSLYQNHFKDVQDIFRMIQIYNDSYLNSIADVLYDRSDLEKNVDFIKTSIENNNMIEIQKKDIKKRLDNMMKVDREHDLADKVKDLMNLIFREKDNDEILSKLYNDLLDKYWRYNK